MADEQPIDRRRYPEQIDLGVLKTDLEFGSSRRTAPNGQQQADDPLYVMVGSAGHNPVVVRPINTHGTITTYNVLIVNCSSTIIWLGDLCAGTTIANGG